MDFLAELSVLDWMVFAILVTSVVSSIRSGFTREAISFGSTVAGLLLAAWFYPVVGEFFLPYVMTHDIASLLGFLLIFLSTLLLGAVTSRLVKKILQVASLEWYDRLLGAAFGIVRAWLVGAVLFLMLTAFPVNLESVQNARLAPYLLAGARVLVIVTPSSVKTKFVESYQKIERLWSDTQKKQKDSSYLNDSFR